MTSRHTREILDDLREARSRTLDLVQDLDDELLMGPRISIINPLRWEIGHVAFFQEFWCLRHYRDRQPILGNGDQLYDSAKVHHDSRWDLPLPSRRDTLAFAQQVLDRVIESNQSQTEKEIDGYGQKYFLELVLYHEQMHAEAITYTRQTLSYKAPQFAVSSSGGDSPASVSSTIVEGDAHVPGGRFRLGSSRGSVFVFDNEEGAHEVSLQPFSISKTAVTQGEFLAFVEDGGYQQRRFWSESGWLWRENAAAAHPVYWRRDQNGMWMRRHFDLWVPLLERLPIIHVNRHEAEAYCLWAGRRLPTEAEWEMAASCEPSNNGLGITTRKRVYPWGDQPPTRDRANLDWSEMGCVEVDALPLGDSAFGCRQMIGNTWEWTSSDFGPYPGFEPGPYKEYSAPWFGDHKVLRGGCWVTRARMIRNAYRNFYTPDRRDVWAGFRTCAV
jgi:gamma-glutamyl hercynylcysteine S-oxide synthase